MSNAGEWFVFQIFRASLNLKRQFVSPEIYKVKILWLLLWLIQNSTIKE